MNKVYCILVTVFLTVSLNACKRANEVHSLNVFENTNDASTYTNLETTAPYWDTDAFPETSDPIENTTPSEPTDPEIAETEDTEQQDTTAPTDPPATTLPEPDITEATEDPTTPSVYPTEAQPTHPSSPNASSNQGSSDHPSHVHTFGYYKVNEFMWPTETRPGEIYRFCECGYRDAHEIPSLNYNVTDPITGEHICALYTTSIPATCIRPQYSLTRCTGCDYTSEYNGSSTQLANHAYSDWSVTKEATATEQGERSRTCSVCGKVNTEIIPATNEQREYYIDPRLKIDVSPEGATSYSSDSLHLGVIDTRTWGAPPSIYIIDDTYLSVIYYNQSGEKIRCYVQPITDRYANVVINENGTYHYFSVGDYSD